jgi:hypothetical protein
MIKKETLEKIKFAMVERIPEEVFLNLDIDQFANYFSDDIVIKVQSFVWAQTLKDQHQIITYPDGWIQAIKARWFKGWLLKKWPVRYKQIIIDVKALYPHFKPTLPDEDYHLKIFKKEMEIK